MMPRHISRLRSMLFVDSHDAVRHISRLRSMLFVDSHDAQTHLQAEVNVVCGQS